MPVPPEPSPQPSRRARHPRRRGPGSWRAPARFRDRAGKLREKRVGHQRRRSLGRSRARPHRPHRALASGQRRARIAYHASPLGWRSHHRSPRLHHTRRVPSPSLPGMACCRSAPRKSVTAATRRWPRPARRKLDSCCLRQPPCFRRARLTIADIVFSYAGVRPVPYRPAEGAPLRRRLPRPAATSCTIMPTKAHSACSPSSEPP